MNEETATTAEKPTPETPDAAETQAPEAATTPEVEPATDNDLAARLRTLADLLEADRAADGVRGDEQDKFMRTVSAELFRRCANAPIAGDFYKAQNQRVEEANETERAVNALEKLAGAADSIATTMKSWTGGNSAASWLDVGVSGSLSLDPE